MKASEVSALFETVAPIESGLQTDRDRRVLGFRFGRPDVEVKGIGVAWFLATEVIEQAAEWRDHGLRHLVVANASILQPSLRRGLASGAPFFKILRGLKKL